MNRVRCALAIASLAAIAACSSDVSTPTAPATPAPSFSAARADRDEEATINLDRKIHELRDDKASKHGGNPGGGTGIYYHGGSVLQAGTTVVAVYWASSPIYTGGPVPGTTGSGAQDGSLVGYFLSHLGGSPYFNINTTYTDGSGHAIVNSVTYHGFWANNANVPANGQRVSDANILTMLQSGFANGSLTYDPNTLYAVFTAGKVNLGGGFGTQYCAYHTHGTVRVGSVNKVVLYAAMPYDNAYPGICTNGTAAPNGDPGADAEVNTLGHETEETTTDLLGTAWFDNQGEENADKCAWRFGVTYSNGVGVANMKIGAKDFLVQQNWVNSGSGGCLTSW